MEPRFLLASNSPRRRDLLTGLGLEFSVVPVDFPELTAARAPWLTPGELALYNSVGKASRARALHPRDLILAADTVVALENQIFEKPSDNQEAFRFLQALSGRTHSVLTSLTLAYPSRPLESRQVLTRVEFRSLSPQEIRTYLANVHVLDKAGAYAVQEHGSSIIARVNGPITNVIGLPVEALAQMLKQISRVSPSKVKL